MPGSTSSAATARSAPAARAAWRSAGRSRWRQRKGRRRARTYSPSTGVMLAFAFPDRVARNRGNGSFVLANGRGAAVEQTSALARAPYIAVAELTGTAAQAAASCWRRRSRRTRSSSASPTRSRAPKRFRSTAARWRLRARRKRTLHAITLSEAPMALSPSAETARSFCRWPDRRRARQTAVVEIAEAMARPRHVPAQGRRRKLARSVR